MLHCLVTEMFAAHLQLMSELTSLYRQNSPVWQPKAEDWLEEAEKLMSRFRFPEGALIATARAGIAKALDMPTGKERNSRHDREKKCRIAVQDALDEAVQLMTHRVRLSEDRLQAFDDKLCEGLTAFFLQNPIPEGSRLPTAEEVWWGLTHFEATKPLSLYIETSLGKTDRDYLLEKVLFERMDSER